MLIRSQKTKVIPIGLCGWHQHGRKKQNFTTYVEEIDERRWYWGANIISWSRLLMMHSTEMQTPTRKSVDKTATCSNPVFAAGERGPDDVEGHARKCVERYCELANEKTEQQYKVSHPCLDDHQIRKEELEMLVPGTKWSTLHSVVSQ